MTVLVTCDQCGAENRLGNLFCRECGSRLDLSKVKAPGRGGAGWGGVASRVIRLAVSLLLLVLLGLLCWPGAPGGDAPAAASLIPKKISALRNAAQRGNEVIEEISEAEINAHLNARLVTPDTGKVSAYQLKLREVRVDIKPEAVRVWLKNELGPLPVTYTAVTRMQRAADGRLTFSAGSVKIGHLPMAGLLRDRALRQMIAVFSRLPEELAFLNNIGRIRLLDGSLEFSTVR